MRRRKGIITADKRKERCHGGKRDREKDATVDDEDLTKTMVERRVKEKKRGEKKVKEGDRMN